ncbi:MAG: FAD-binding oxidoreductase [Crenarchaeota archaeon]|nr:FAD-binding oxidoreductase [Thermoproteota archaeon]
MRVVIVGAGVSGLFIAYELAREGIDRIVVLERSYVGAGSTGRCATGIRASFTSEEHVVLMRESIRLWEEHSRGELGDYGLTFVRGGYLWVARREETLDYFRKLVSLHNRLGVPTRVIGADEAKELVPQLRTDIIAGAMHDPTAGKSYVFTTLRALMKACSERGVEIRTRSAVTKLAAEGGVVKAAVLESGERIKGDVFVIAAGSGSRELLKTLGIELPTKNMPRHIMVTEAFARAFDPLVVDWDTPGAPYTVQSTEGNFFIARELEEEPELSIYSQRIDFIPKALKPIAELLPFLRAVRVLRYWIGYYVTTPDNHPVYGPVKSYSNLFLATGFSGHGYMMGPVTGKVIASWVLRGKPCIEHAARLTLERFEKGALIKELAVVG